MTKRTPNDSSPLGLKSHFATCDEVLEPKALPYLTLEAEVEPINKVSCGSNPLRAHRSTRAALSPKFRGRLPLPPPDEWMSPLSAPGFFFTGRPPYLHPLSDTGGSANGEARRRRGPANRRSVRPKGAGFKGDRSGAALPFCSRCERNQPTNGPNSQRSNLPRRC